MKNLKSLMSILLGVFFTITTSASQTVYLVEEPGNLYFDFEQGDEMKDTLARFDSLPTWVTPEIAKLATTYPGKVIMFDATTRIRLHSLGFICEEIKQFTVTSWDKGKFTSPELKSELIKRSRIIDGLYYVA